jgi:LPXTG-motif cell wall-anchored protein
MWMIKDKIDGMAADPRGHRLIITLDEDARTHLATISPSAAAGQQITNYTYSPDPRGATTPVALRTGGGTDQVSVDSAGHILITASHAGLKTGTAVFKVVLTPPSSPTGTGTAALSPTFLDDATAANGTGTGTTKLALGDVDSGSIVPQNSPRFGGSYVITDQTALELVFATNIFNGTGLTVLKTPFGLDDLLWTTSSAGTLYVVDHGPTTVLPKVSQSALYKVTGPFATNTVLASNDGVGDQVVTVNLTNGKLTPFVQHLNTTKGLVYLDPSGTQTALTLNGSTTTPASTTTTSTTPKKKTSSSNTALIVIIIVVVVALLGGGGYYFTRRRSAG